ncbi:hypothetical protein EGK14_02550 [Erwinia sp. 198]|jgi:hypothetical protein|nr:hypothetical protein EGK14_02550 [Erwinia sp. 198]
MFIKKKPPGWEALLFVFACFLIRRIASRSTEGKKEGEEERQLFHQSIHDCQKVKVTAAI